MNTKKIVSILILFTLLIMCCSVAFASDSFDADDSIIGSNVDDHIVLDDDSDLDDDDDWDDDSDWEDDDSDYDDDDDWDDDSDWEDDDSDYDDDWDDVFDWEDDDWYIGSVDDIAKSIYISRLSYSWTIDEDGNIAFANFKGPLDSYYGYGLIYDICPGCGQSDSVFKVKYNKLYATGGYAVDKTISYLASNSDGSNSDDASEPSENETEDEFEEEVSYTYDGCETSCAMDYKSVMKSHFKGQAPAVSSPDKTPAKASTSANPEYGDDQISNEDSKIDLPETGIYSGSESSAVKSVNFDNYQNMIDNSIEDKNTTAKTDNEINGEAVTFDGESNILLLFITLLLSIILII